MIIRIRLFVLLARPAVIVLLGLFAATGLAQAGAGNDGSRFIPVLVVVIAYLLCSVAINDLADEAIDRVNLAGDAARPLVTGSGSHQLLATIAATAGAVAISTSALIAWQALAVVAAGLALSIGYSVRPVRLADRGALASLLLPAGYVAVPYLVGVLAVRPVRAADLVLLGGLYIGFIGRIVLKDFRDVRGDALFGKRTFLVRHGRSATCKLSAVCWIVGIVTVAGVRGVDATFTCLHVAQVAGALVLLRALATDGGPRRDERLIAAIAIVGRGMVVTLIAQLTMVDAGWGLAARSATLLTFAVVMLGQTATMTRRGPTSGLTTADVVGLAGFEPATSASRTQRSTKLSHSPSSRSQPFRPSTGDLAGYPTCSAVTAGGGAFVSSS